MKRGRGQESVWEKKIGKGLTLTPDEDIVEDSERDSGRESWFQ